MLVVDKPAGLTSHDVVAVARRSIGERQIGHTGTLDPLATGVLPLACGRATRLVRFFTASEKDYDATIRFGLATDTYDVTGRPTRETGGAPTADQLEAAIASLRGDYLQTPPPYSAKKVGGERAYALARKDKEVTLTPVPVSVRRASLQSWDGSRAVVSITCSAGFYVRVFAHELGSRVETGACLEALRRTRSGDFDLGRAIPFESLREAPESALERLIGMDDLLPAMKAVRLSPEGRRRVSHGLDVDARHLTEGGIVTGSGGAGETGGGSWVRLLDEAGSVLALAQPSASRSDALHPSIVLI